MKHLILLSILFPLFSDAQSFLKFYTNPPDSAGFFCTNIPTCLANNSDGGYYIGGYTCTPDSPSIQKMQLRKIDVWGNELWSRIDHVTTYDEIDDVVTYDDSTIFCAVRLGSQAGVAKRKSNGEVAWTKNLFPQPDTCSRINSLFKSSDGNLVVCGVIYECIHSTSSILIAKVDSSGMLIWQHIIDIPYPFGSGAMEVVESLDSFYWVTSFTGYIDTAVNVDIPQFSLAKYTLSGQQLFYKTYGTSQLGFKPFSLAYLPNNTIAVAGACVYPPFYQNDGYFAILNDTGLLLNILIDTIANENEYIKIKTWNDYVYMLEYTNEFYPSPDTSEDIKLSRYSISANKIDFSKSYTLLGAQGLPYDMEVLANGSIAIMFTESDSIHSTCAALVVLDSLGCVPSWCATLIREINIENISVFPNPFSQSFSITGIHDADIILFDFLGRQVINSRNVNDNTFYFPDALADGIYFLRIKQGDSIKTAKLFHVN